MLGLVLYTTTTTFPHNLYIDIYYITIEMLKYNIKVCRLVYIGKRY